MTMHTIKLLGVTGLVLSVAACGGKADDTGTTVAAETEAENEEEEEDGFEWPEDTADAVTNYANIVVASYEDSVITATALNDALTALVTNPSNGTLGTAKDAWLASREPYLQTEVYRFYEGPIDNETDGPEGLINAWPLDEAYIDYVIGADGNIDYTVGMVNDGTTIDAATLEAANEVGGDANIATGYHAVEFLLWGQDTDPNGPGNRSYTDYSGEGAAQNADRRGLYLTTVGTMVVDHLLGVHDQWVDGATYRADFESDTAAAIEKMLTGMIILSGFETGGERLQAALDAADQEEEHSCFSDNTHRDMIQDVQGVWNVWHGTYVRTDGSSVSGTSLESIVAQVDSDLAGRVTDKIDESLSLANALPIPFDQAIAEGSSGRAAVEALVVSLSEQESILQEVFDTLGLSVEIPTE